ncbi:MAG: YdcF family protein [Frankiaceae bacterium]|nr:YdcF family protein [Frankiaceae bacterium]
MLFAFRWMRRLVSLVVVAVLLVLGGTAAGVWWTARQDDRPVSDAIVVLGAAQFDGRPSSVFKARLQHARALYEDGVAPRVITVGGSREGDRTTEAEAGAAFLEERGVDTVAVAEGRNTLQSVEAVEQLMQQEGWETAVIVTDPWHSLRSVRMARDVGIDAQTSPTRAGPSVRTRGTQARYIARETLALLYYEILGRSGESGPSAV